MVFSETVRVRAYEFLDEGNISLTPRQSPGELN